MTRAVVASAGSDTNAAQWVVPETLLDSLAAQLDKLDSRTRELAQVAAVIGRDFSYNLLKRVHNHADSVLREDLV